MTNAATNITFTVSDGAFHTVAQFVLPSLPAGQWVYVGSPVLAAAGSNVLEMAVSGASQPGACAVADVIKLAPLVAVPPVLGQPYLAGTVFSATVATQFGLDYVLECENSPQAAAWTPVQAVSGNGSEMVLSDASADAAARFYRVRVQWH